MLDATPHHGIPPFILGMTRSQALVAAGQPDKADALALLAAAAGIPDVRQTDDFEESGRCHESELFDLQFWEAEGRIVNVTLFPQYEEGGNVPRWPAASLKKHPITD